MFRILWIRVGCRRGHQGSQISDGLPRTASLRRQGITNAWIWGIWFKHFLLCPLLRVTSDALFACDGFYRQGPWEGDHVWPCSPSPAHLQTHYSHGTWHVQCHGSGWWHSFHLTCCWVDGQRWLWLLPSAQSQSSQSELYRGAIPPEP